MTDTIKELINKTADLFSEYTALNDKRASALINGSSAEIMELSYQLGKLESEIKVNLGLAKSFMN